MSVLRGRVVSGVGNFSFWIDRLRDHYARKTGMQYHVDLHIEVDPAMSVADAHVVAGHVRGRIRTDLPWVADVLVHVEPAGPRPA